MVTITIVRQGHEPTNNTNTEILVNNAKNWKSRSLTGSWSILKLIRFGLKNSQVFTYNYIGYIYIYNNWVFVTPIYQLTGGFFLVSKQEDHCSDHLLRRERRMDFSVLQQVWKTSRSGMGRNFLSGSKKRNRNWSSNSYNVGPPR